LSRASISTGAVRALRDDYLSSAAIRILFLNSIAKTTGRDVEKHPPALGVVS
jgi:hypothetical protein